MGSGNGETAMWPLSCLGHSPPVLGSTFQVRRRSSEADAGCPVRSWGSVCSLWPLSTRFVETSHVHDLLGPQGQDPGPFQVSPCTQFKPGLDKALGKNTCGMMRQSPDHSTPPQAQATNLTANGPEQVSSWTIVKFSVANSTEPDAGHVNTPKCWGMPAPISLTSPGRTGFLCLPSFPKN